MKTTVKNNNVVQKKHYAKSKLNLVSLLLAICFCSSIYGQKDEKETYIAFSTGVDIRNAIVGSKATGNKPALDVLYQFAMVGQNIEVTINYERFNTIHFDKFSFGVGYHFPLYARIGNSTVKTILVPSVEPLTLINRWGGGWSSNSHLALGAVNLAFRWNLSDKIAIEWLNNALPRTDLSARYPQLNTSAPIVVSSYAKVLYKF